MKKVLQFFALSLVFPISTLLVEILESLGQCLISKVSITTVKNNNILVKLQEETEPTNTVAIGFQPPSHDEEEWDDDWDDK